jgi:protein-disulfide isomerase
VVKKRKRTRRTAKKVRPLKRQSPISKQNILLYILIGIIALAIFLNTGERSPGEKEVIIAQCTPPSILINGQCCVDNNNNKQCDNQETRVARPAQPLQKQPTYQPSSTTFTVKSMSTQQGAEPVALGGVISMDDDPTKGNQRAPVMVIEFSNYKCTSCKQAYKYNFPKLETEFLNTGKVQYVFRDFVYGTYGIKAEDTAVVAGCAREQNKFWEMHDALFDKTRRYTRQEYLSFAKELRLDLPQFNDCLDKRSTQELRDDYNDGKAATIAAGVPVYFVNGYKVVGHDYEQLKKAIENVLSGTWT